MTENGKLLHISNLGRIWKKSDRENKYEEINYIIQKKREGDPQCNPSHGKKKRLHVCRASHFYSQVYVKKLVSCPSMMEM